MDAKVIFSIGLVSLASGVRVDAGSSPKINGNGPQRPNIIFLLTDDQRWDALGYAGNPYIKTPNLDRLASQGVYFRNTYATSAISCASRAACMSGMYGSGSGILDFDTPFTEEQLRKTYPELLQAAGYYIGFIGKYGINHMDLSGIAPEFDYWRGFVNQGFYFDPKFKGEHLTSVQGKQMVEFLDTMDKDKPFCLSVSFKAPHCDTWQKDKNGNLKEEFPIDPRDEHLYDGVVFPEPHSASHYEDFNELFRHSSEGKENEGRKRWKLRFDTPEKYQETVRKYYSLISGVDREVGKLMEELEERGLADNTVIIFMGDNGFYLGEHGLAGKWWSHEESARLPFFIYDPRLKASERGQISESIVLNMDVMPTILELAGVRIPSSVQAKSLVPVLHDVEKTVRKDFFYEHRFLWKPVHIPSCEGVINGRYKLIRYYTFDGEWWLLNDMLADPLEEKNFADDPAYAPIRRKMEKRLNKMKKEIVKACPER